MGRHRRGEAKKITDEDAEERLNKLLVDSGHRDRLRERLSKKLDADGWREEVKESSTILNSQLSSHLYMYYLEPTFPQIYICSTLAWSANLGEKLDVSGSRSWSRRLWLTTPRSRWRTSSKRYRPRPQTWSRTEREGKWRRMSESLLKRRLMSNDSNKGVKVIVMALHWQKGMEGMVNKVIHSIHM